MKPAVAALLVLAFTAPSSGQQFITVGTGFGTMSYGSDALDRFKETYNFVNGPNLTTLLRGFGSGEGLRLEAGYRRLSRVGGAVLVGVQNHVGKDLAQFQNGEVRDLKLTITSFFVESELGYTHRSFFVNGLFALHARRNLTLESRYVAPSDAVRNPLTGTYKSHTPVATDLGIAIGFHREPVILMGKITYPVHTGGKSNLLEDPDPDKIADGFNYFPADFVRFLNREDYEGIASDVDGLKIVVTVAVAIPIGAHP